MAITYTTNLGLAMQQDKSDRLNWDAVTENWQKIDTAFGNISVSNAAGNAVLVANGADRSVIGIAEQEDE